ncbi:MAG: HEAT repeat domain-containing protein [Halobacteriaceae archaeon]
MSDGDEEPEDDGAASPTNEEDAVDYELDEETFEQRLEDAADAVEAAETETDLDEVTATLDAIDDDLERADLPEPDDDDEEGPAAAFTDRLAELRGTVEEKRGPYAEDVVAHIEDVQTTIQETEWTDDGVDEVATAIEAFIAAVADAIDTDHDVPSGKPADLADGLDPVAATIADADLDADADADTLESLVDAVETLEADVADAEEWDDLTVREQLQAQGFYDSLGDKHKDFPPEWTAIKEWENQGDPEPILLALDAFDSDFMERHCLEALERLGDPAATDAMLERAERRDQPAIRILGKIGEPEDSIVETLVEYVGTESDPALQRVSMKALGEMGATDATQAIADQLVAENAGVRSQAARALGLLGDPRAIDPLADVLGEDADDAVRASAAWALTQIGTEPALTAAAEYADDAAYVVQAEAEQAADAIGEDAPTA